MNNTNWFYQNRTWLGIVRYNSTTGDLEVGGAAIPRANVVTSMADLPSPGAESGQTYFVANPGNNDVGLPCWAYSNGVDWSTGLFLLAADCNNKLITAPAATWVGAYTMASVGGDAFTKVTSAGGVHGLTTVGNYIRVTGGTNWTPGLYKITVVDSTTALTINHPFDPDGQVLGQPTFALAGTSVEHARIRLPALTARRGMVRIGYTVDYTGASTAQVLSVYHQTANGAIGGTEMHAPNITAAGEMKHAVFGFQNAADSSGNYSTAIQNTFMTLTDQDGFGASTAGTVVSGTIQTNVPTDIIFAHIGVAEQTARLSYRVECAI